MDDGPAQRQPVSGSSLMWVVPPRLASAGIAPRAAHEKARLHGKQTGVSGPVSGRGQSVASAGASSDWAPSSSFGDDLRRPRDTVFRTPSVSVSESSAFSRLA